MIPLICGQSGHVHFPMSTRWRCSVGALAFQSSTLGLSIRFCSGPFCTSSAQKEVLKPCVNSLPGSQVQTIAASAARGFASENEFAFSNSLLVRSANEDVNSFRNCASPMDSSCLWLGGQTRAHEHRSMHKLFLEKKK